MLLEHRGKRPRIAASAYVAPNAVVCGDVVIGEHSRVLFGAVLTAETGSIAVGSHCIVMEQALIRGRDGHPTRLGDHVLVGPHAHLNGADIEDESFLATGVAVFPGAIVGRGSEVRVGAIVHVNSTLEPAATVPIGWIRSAGRRGSSRPTATTSSGRSSESSTSPGPSSGCRARRRPCRG